MLAYAVLKHQCNLWFVIL